MGVVCQLEQLVGGRADGERIETRRTRARTPSKHPAAAFRGASAAAAFPSTLARHEAMSSLGSM